MKGKQRSFQLGCLVLLILVIGFLVWFVSNAVPQIRYNRRSYRINEKIISLQQRRPENVSEQAWADCVAWASIAHCNICFSEGHTSYQAMCRFEDQLDEKLQGEVDLDTIEWIGERLAETGPHGRQYMNKWWETWKSMHEAWGQEFSP